MVPQVLKNEVNAANENYNNDGIDVVPEIAGIGGIIEEDITDFCDENDEEKEDEARAIDHGPLNIILLS